VVSRSRLAWGLVGALSFLVLVQAYELILGPRIGWLSKIGVAIAVSVITVGLIPFVERRLGIGSA